jgi:hypothetical protein
MPREIIDKAFTALSELRQRNTTLEDFDQHYNCTIQRMGPYSTTMYRDIRFNSEADATYFLLRFS